MSYLLLFSVFVISTCGLVYELIAGTLASYLLGDSVTQFSTVIGVYLFSMGIGSFFSRYITRDLISVFIRVELLIALVGGSSAALLFLLFEHVSSFRVVLYSLVSITGTLVGLEIPLLMRILKNRLEFKDLVSQIFTFDYVGALLASLLFPLLLVPHLGLVRSSFLFGFLNALVALWTLRVFRNDVRWPRAHHGSAVFVLLLLFLGLAYSDRIMSYTETAAYPDNVIYAHSSEYQRLVITRGTQDLRLYLNGNLQFSSRDEYRYHEALVHLGLSSLKSPRKVLILGGGDGMAAREVLKHPSIDSITLVDLDPKMTELFSKNDSLSRLNDGALRSPRVRIVNADAFIWLRENQERFDFVVVDFPDPSNYSIGKLFSTAFYKILYRAVADEGAAVIQSTSPWVARRTFWCVNSTVASVGFHTTPYHAFVPSFGEWGFILATRRPFQMPSRFVAGLKFVTADSAQGMLHFPPDMGPLPTEINRLNNQVLVRYYEDEWSEYVH